MTMTKLSLSRNTKKSIKGIVQADRSTKRLLRRIRPGAIAVIAHDDLDELAVRGLVQAKVKAVVNAGRTMSGRLLSTAVLPLLEQGIPLFEIETQHFAYFHEEDEIAIGEHGILLASAWIAAKRFVREDWHRAYQAARAQETACLAEFVDNTLLHAEQEKHYMLESIESTQLGTRLEGRSVVIVARGTNYIEDLACLKFYIASVKPILIGVDGGADALIEEGYTPDMIVGDMDSVSDRALRSGAELIVHAYRGGAAPGLARLERLGLQAQVLAAGGTSEDLALLLAYDHQCERMVTVGLHSHLHDFAAKGRSGMGSTWLVLMKVGSRLIDARGFSTLYPYVAQAARSVPESSYSGKRTVSRALLELCRRLIIFPRKERNIHGAAHFRHHSRLE
ncbi:hypothetical protein PAESOLCIP111_01509 [Paenibacillus solanacearum]|uniref:Thiamin pyrophosphokinase catalytic domain-containing protein n=1 Tax=Paenibacillus solanacearum TaxID=2048548 RepID=A0A916NHV5_9BACL|nr:putative cytokinetic ring protein SteA [Paenibacillus solanacearum]CAG7612273.1 hypothetical protein PAESOLCIP111_01509 [Paenibacillus solanacearum]